MLAGSPAALRGYARFRSELRHGTLRRPALERIALAVAEHYALRRPGIALHARTARQAGLGLDEVALARECDSRDEREAALLRYLRPLVERQARRRCTSTRRRARRAGPTSSSSRRSPFVALETFTAMVNFAGDVPADGSVEQARTLRGRMSTPATALAGRMSLEPEAAARSSRAPAQPPAVRSTTRPSS